MPTLYEDDFDSEEEGTSPPANFIASPTQVPTNCEVDDAQYHSSPHSMLLANASGWGSCRHEVTFYAELLTIWLYFAETNKRKQAMTQETTGDQDQYEFMTQVQFDELGNIEYKVDTTWYDSGYNYTTGWHKLEFLHYFAEDKFSMWYDGTLVIDKKGFRNSGSVVRGIHFRVYQCSLWVDDILVAGWPSLVGGVEGPKKVAGIETALIDKIGGVP